MAVEAEPALAAAVGQVGLPPLFELAHRNADRPKPNAPFDARINASPWDRYRRVFARLFTYLIRADDWPEADGGRLGGNRKCDEFDVAGEEARFRRFLRLQRRRARPVAHDVGRGGGVPGAARGYRLRCFPRRGLDCPDDRYWRR